MAPLPSLCRTRLMRAKTALARFAPDRSGNIALMFAVLAVPMISAVGMAVDHGWLLGWLRPWPGRYGGSQATQIIDKLVSKYC